MKRVAFLAFCIVLSSTLTALGVSFTDDGFFRGTVTPYSATMNKVEISLISGGDTEYPIGWDVISLEGSFQVFEPTASIYLGGNTSSWVMRTTNVANMGEEPAPPPQSFINFDMLPVPAAATYTGTLPNAKSFASTWMTSTPAKRLSPTGTSMLATIYVDNGSTVGFTGQVGFVQHGGTDTFTQSVSFMVPEPGTFAMVIAGVLALLGIGLARRRHQ